MTATDQAIYLRARESLLWLRASLRPDAYALVEPLYRAVASRDPADLPTLHALTSQAEAMRRE
jgi:hypothetical protein